MELPSALLIGRAQLGNRSALDELLRSVEEPLFRHILGIVGDRDDALDVLQKVLLTVARRLSTLRDPVLFRAWCFRIATRDALRHKRTNERWTTALRGDEFPEVSDERTDTPFDSATLEELADLVAKLPPGSQIVVRLFYYDDLSYAEICEALDLSLGTVRSRLAYGRGLLRSMMLSPRYVKQD